jgi:thymidylate synthase
MYFCGEKGYLNLLKETLENGENKATRNGNVISIFGCMTNFKDISSSFPLITTKRMFFRGIVEELLWFLRGSTDAKELKDKNIHPELLKQENSTIREIPDFRFELNNKS